MKQWLCSSVMDCLFNKNLILQA